MNIKTLQYFNSECAKINVKETKTLGLKIIKLFEEFGEFSCELIKMKGETYKSFEKEHLIEELIDVQTLISSIYEMLKKRNAMISDSSALKIADLNLSQLKVEYGDMKEPIWLYFKLIESLGKLASTIKPRHKKEDDQFRVKHLMIAQSYIIYYFNMLKLDIFPEMSTSEYDKFVINMFNLKVEKWKSSIDKYIVNSESESIYSELKTVESDKISDKKTVDPDKISDKTPISKPDKVKPPKKIVPDAFLNNTHINKVMGDLISKIKK